MKGFSSTLDSGFGDPVCAELCALKWKLAGFLSHAVTEFWSLRAAGKH